jgi:hypothetical protein
MKLKSFIHKNQKIIQIINIIFYLIGLILISWPLFEAKPIKIIYEETFYGIITDYRPIINAINQLALNTNLLIKMWIGFIILVINNASKLIFLIIKEERMR